MNLQTTIAAIEALLLATDGPLPQLRLADLLPDATPHTLDEALTHLHAHYAGAERGIHLVHVADALQFRTNPAFAPTVRAMYESKPVRLSRPAMETLAIVAYRQPVTRAQIEEVRGVDSSGVLRTLSDHALVEVIGRLDDLGKPLLYGTTGRFLEFFGLHGLTELPTLDESEADTLHQMKLRLDAEGDHGEE
ncbi:MAG: SMC-Scp complex subunit ScpB [Bradymonadaceae bacterium]|nr:SMC-Scp complex subunit ScpB [Lujinxingiaceae bacterium]